MKQPRFKAGAQLYMRAQPANTGTIGVITGAGFTIIWHDPARKPGQPRLRVRYPFSAAHLFTVGKPHNPS